MRNRYKFAILIFTLIFLVFLPHNNLLNNIESALKEKTVLSKNSNDTAAEQKAIAQARLKAAQERKTKQDALLLQLNQTLTVNDQFAVSIIDINNS